MNPCLCVLLLCFHCILSVVVDIHDIHNIVADRKEELMPIYIRCSLNDVIRISAPIVNHNVSIIQLSQPNGDIRNLHIALTKDAFKPDSHENSVVVKYNKRREKFMSLLNNYNAFNLNLGHKEDSTDEIFEENFNRMKGNDFMIGPVSEEDHGNWVLSLYAHENGEWLELYQVIDIRIEEFVPPQQILNTVKKGDTFRFGFAYPIVNLQSCEFIAPKTTFDRWYDRDQGNLDHCMFVIDNVTKDDEGLWIVIGVGKVVYNTQTTLNVI